MLFFYTSLPIHYVRSITNVNIIFNKVVAKDNIVLFGVV